MPDEKLLFAGIHAARTDFGVDDAIAGIIHDIAGSIATAVSAAVVATPAGKPVMVVVTMMTPVVAMSTPMAMTATEVMTAAVEATTATMAATVAATGGGGSDESCGRSERNDYEKKLTKHFYLHLLVRDAPFQCCEVMPRVPEVLCGRSHRPLLPRKGGPGAHFLPGWTAAVLLCSGDRQDRKPRPRFVTRRRPLLPSRRWPRR